MKPTDRRQVVHVNFFAAAVRARPPLSALGSQPLMTEALTKEACSLGASWAAIR
jgi:hypothetical protein